MGQDKAPKQRCDLPCKLREGCHMERQILSSSLKDLSIAVMLFVLATSACQKQQQSKNTAPPSSAPESVANHAPGQNEPSPAPLSYADVIERTGPAVVTIRSERRVRAP